MSYIPIKFFILLRSLSNRLHSLIASKSRARPYRFELEPPQFKPHNSSVPRFLRMHALMLHVLMHDAARGLPPHFTFSPLLKTEEVGILPSASTFRKVPALPSARLR